MKRLRFAMGIGALAAMGLACGSGFLDGISGGSAPVVDAGPLAEAGAEAGPMCESARWPARPAIDDTAGAIGLTFAVDRIRIDTNATEDAGVPKPQGFDLDRTCTCVAQGDSCQRPTGQKPACDGPRGQDNVLSQLFNQLNVGLPTFTATFATDRVRTGFFTILVDVRGWNGEPDDPSVLVTIRLSQEIDKKAPDGGRPKPLFDGHDLWTVDPDTIVGGDPLIGKDCRDEVESGFGCVAKVLDAKAYIAGGKLVAFPRKDPTGLEPVPIKIRSAAGALSFNFLDFVVVADISGPKGGPYRIDGEMAGRIRADDFATNLANLQDISKPGTNEPPLCESNTGLVEFLKSSVCSARDLTKPANDGTGQKCDYLSSALAFGASPALVGNVLRKDAVLSPCGDASLTCE